MKIYTKPEISKVELFTQDAIALSIPKTKYTLGEKNGNLVAYALQEGEAISGNTNVVTVE